MRHALHLLVILLGFSSPVLAQEPERYRLVMLGDSLTAGFNLPDQSALPAALDRALDPLGLAHVEVINAGVSGDTTAAGLSRFGFSVGPEADGVLIALGANDALQGQPPEQAQDNIRAMIRLARERDLDVLLAGMIAPLNMGEDYRARFDGLYIELEESENVPLYPFLLAPVALEPDLLMIDGLHPTAEGVTMMATPLADFVAQSLFTDAP